MHIIQRVQRRLRRIYYGRLGSYRTVIHGQPFTVVSDHVDFWHNVSRAIWEQHTYTFLSRWLTPSTVYFDVGAWIGPTALYAATRCKEVVCFEPDPVAYGTLLGNIALNGLHNVRTYCVAMSDRFGVAKMSSFGAELGDSQTSLLNPGRSRNSIDAVTVSWEAFVESAALGLPGVIKIDIEGGEFRLLPSMQGYLEKHKPILCLSTHAPFLGDNRRLDAMRLLRAALTIYDTVLDENLTETTLDALEDPRSLSEFRTFYFLSAHG
jgi:FkbM family methyltransferase